MRFPFQAIITASFSNDKVAFMHNLTLVCSIENAATNRSQSMGGELYRVETTAHKETATRRCPIQPAIKGCIEKKTQTTFCRRLTPCVLWGLNPSLMYTKQINYNLIGILCQYTAKLWHNTTLHLTKNLDAVLVR
jgi:hypothetical protein